MTGIQLTSENSFEKKSENAAQSSSDELEEFINAEKEKVEVEIEEG
jgi:hypothetical protein